MPRVFITQEEATHNYTTAEAFGEIRCISVSRRDDFNAIRGGENNKLLMAHLRQQLRDFTEDDYMVVTGSPYVNAAVFWILGKRGLNSLRLLRWDNRGGGYIPLIIDYMRQETLA